MSIQRQTEIMEQGQETLTGYSAVIDSDHAYIHDGIAYTAIIDLGTISAATKIGFTTPTVASGKYVHWRPIGLQTSADYVKFELYEGDSFTGGTAASVINRNRLSSNTTGMQNFDSGVTVTPAGTVIQHGGVGTSGNPATRSGGGGSAAEEIVLKQNTDYVVQITPDGSTDVVMELFWYEESAGLDEA